MDQSGSISRSISCCCCRREFDYENKVSTWWVADLLNIGAISESQWACHLCCASAMKFGGDQLLKAWPKHVTILTVNQGNMQEFKDFFFSDMFRVALDQSAVQFFA